MSTRKSKPHYTEKHHDMRSCLICMVLLTSLSLGFVGKGYAQRSAKAAYEAAESLRNKGKNKEAIAKYEEAIAAGPNNYKYYLQKGRCEFALGQFKPAERSFQLTLKNRPNYAVAHAWLARTYKQQENLPAAIDQYKLAARASEEKNSKFQYYLLLVNLLMDDGKDEDAKSYLDMAAEIKPTHYNILYYQAEFAARDGRWTEARDIYQKALTLPELKKQSETIQAKFYYGLGVAHASLGSESEAEAAFSKANFGPYKKLIEKRETSDEQSQLYKIALSYYFNEAYAESYSYADKVLAVSPGFSGAHMLKGRIALKRGSFEEGITHYKRAIEAEEEPSRKAKIQLMLANLYLDQSRANDAMRVIQDLGRTEARLATNPRVLAVKARSQYESKRYEEAISTLNALLATDLDAKTAAKYQFLLGMSARKSGDTETAKAAFAKAAYGPYKPAAEQELKDLK